MGHHELKEGSKHLFWHPTWSRMICGKSSLGPRQTHFGTHLVWAQDRCLLQPNGHQYGGQGIRLGDVKKKMGGCGWSRHLPNQVLSQFSQDMACCWYAADCAYCSQSLQILGL